MQISERLKATIDALDIEYDGDRDKIMEALLQAAKTNYALASDIKKAGGSRAISNYDAEMKASAERMQQSLDDDPERKEIADLVAEHLGRQN